MASFRPSPPPPRPTASKGAAVRPQQGRPHVPPPPPGPPVGGRTPGSGPGGGSRRGPGGDGEGGGPGQRGWAHEHPFMLCFLVVAAILAVLALVWLLRAPHVTASGDFEVHHVYWHGHDHVVLRDDRDYYQYLNLSARPALVSISASFANVACSAEQDDRDGVVGRLLEANETARDALQEARRITPPPAFEALHKRLTETFQDTQDTATTVVGCVRSGDAQCQDGQEQAVELLGSVSGLASELRTVVKAPAPGGL